MIRLALVLLLFLSGCSGTNGSLFGTSSYETFGTMYGKFEDGNVGMATQVMSQKCPDNPEAKAWCEGAKQTSIAVIALRQFSIHAPKTGMDVLDHAVGSVPIVWAVKSLGDAVKSVSENGGTTNINNSNINDSLNHTSTTQVSSGSGAVSTSSTPSGNQPVNTNSYNTTN